MTDIADEIFDWAASRLVGPHIDSYNRPVVLAEALKEAPTPGHMWGTFEIGLSGCDRMPDEVESDILAVLKAQPLRGVELLNDLNQTFFDSLPDVITIYRGAQKIRSFGMSWTTDIEVAKLFAKGHRGYRVPDGRIVQTTIKKSDILTVSQDRGESTVVVDPWLVLEAGRISSVEASKVVAAKTLHPHWPPEIAWGRPIH